MIDRKNVKKTPSLLRRRLRGKGGYSLVEALAAIVILMLVSSGMVETIHFAVNQYHKQVTYSEAKVLCSTLTNVIRGELSNTSHIKLTGSKLDSFFSPNYSIDGIDPTGHNKVAFYAVDVKKNSDGTLTLSTPSGSGGELLLGKSDGGYVGNLLVSSATYSTYHLRVGVPDITYSGGVFSVTLNIYTNEGDPLIVNHKFDVLPLNTPTIDDT